MGDDELAVLILSGWSDGPLPALEHSLRQRGLRCVRVPLPMPPCGVYWCANPFLLLLAGVVWLMIYALNELTLEPAALYIVLIIAGALVAARLCVDGDGPVLGRDAVVELQRRTLELYRSEAFWDVPKDDVRALDAFKSDLLAEFGFAGERGARAAERAVARFLDDEEVFANAKRLFELGSGV